VRIGDAMVHMMQASTERLKAMDTKKVAAVWKLPEEWIIFNRDRELEGRK
jgi:hypothetical protein